MKLVLFFTVLLMLAFLSTTVAEEEPTTRKLMIEIDNLEANYSSEFLVTFTLKYDTIEEVLNKTLDVPAGGRISAYALFDIPLTPSSFLWTVTVSEGEKIILKLEGVMDLSSSLFIKTYYDPGALTIPLEPSVLTLSAINIEGHALLEAKVNRVQPYNVSIAIDGDLSGDFSPDETYTKEVVPEESMIEIRTPSIEAVALKAPFRIEIKSNSSIVLRLEGIIDWSKGEAIKLDGWKDKDVVDYMDFSITYNMTGNVMRMSNSEILHIPVKPEKEHKLTTSLSLTLGKKPAGVVMEIPSSKEDYSSTPTTNLLTKAIEEINDLLKFYWPFLVIVAVLLISYSISRRG